MDIDFPLAAKNFELWTNKLGAVVDDQNSQEAGEANDIFQEKLNQIHVFDVGVRFYFHPF